jgi:exonuclease SbcD
LVEQPQCQQIDAIVVAGDIFDTGTSPSYAREMYFDFIAKLHQVQCQLVV